ncbi:MAG: PD-(D/E)XK nuclease family protein [Candidatus Puniceispirillales bacterium WSBS_2018_MAG_OTU23]
MTTEQTPSIREFEDLLINNPELDKIGNYLKRFNPIKTMRMEGMEIRHSAILAWLLDPQESHGMGDQFLKAFLAKALPDSTSKHQKLCALDISQADMMDTEVRREWRNIDLLIISHANGWVFIIENKFHSKQHGKQLTDYYKTVEDVFGSDKKVQGIFLTLNKEKPDDEHYTQIYYEDVLEVLKRSIDNQIRPLSSEVYVFLQHYIEVIEEVKGMNKTNNDMVELARKLYRNNRKVFDFVLEHGTTDDFSIACETLFKTNLGKYNEVKVGEQEYVYFDKSRSQKKITFLPKKWFDAFGGQKYEWIGCQKNWGVGLPVICWFENINNGAQLELQTEVGPINDHEFRKNLIKEINSNGLVNVFFQGNEDQQYSRFLKKNTREITDANNSEEIMTKMKGLLEDFAPIFEGLTETIEHWSNSADGNENVKKSKAS